MVNIEIIDVDIKFNKIYIICKYDKFFYLSINNIIDNKLDEFYIRHIRK